MYLINKLINKKLKLILILINFINNSYGTNLLPLELYELPSKSDTGTDITKSITSTTTTQSIKIFNHLLLNSTNNNNNSNNNNNNNNNISFNLNKNLYNRNSDHRRYSRQMLRDTIIKMKSLHDHQPQKILYQVGESEDDLPICAPNAICSKIDLYETPWIERQCRCPINSNLDSEKIIIHHNHNHHHHHHHHKHNHDHYHHNNNNNNNNNNEHYHHHNHDKENTNNRNDYNNLLFDKKSNNNELNTEKFDDIHLRKFMQKYQAVYKDDILLDENHKTNNKDNIDNEFIVKKNYQNTIYNQKTNRNDLINKLRHFSSGNVIKKNLTLIGGCPSDIDIDDGHTIIDKTRQYKLCNPVHKLPLCNSFKDYTWTLTTLPEFNVTEQIVHCRCRPNSVTYLSKWEPIIGKSGYTYSFACSPQSRLRCQRKEPCKLFTVRKRQEFLDEVNTNPLCQCPKGHKCPNHHTDSGVIAGKTFIEDNIQTYSGYCMAND